MTQERHPLPWATGNVLHLPCKGCGTELRSLSVKANCPSCGLPVSASVHVGAAERQVTQRTCEVCGYNLHGVEHQARCPECGTELHGRNVRDEPLASAPMPLVTEVARRLTLVALFQLAVISGPVVAIAGVVMRAPAGFESVPFFITAAGLCLTAWFLTIPLDEPDARLHGLHEHARLRRWARWGILPQTLFPVVIFVAELDEVETGMSNSDFVYAGFVVLLILAYAANCFGMAATAAYARGYATWIRDESSDTVLRTAAILLGLTPLVALFSLIPIIGCFFWLLPLVAFASYPLGMVMLGRSARLSVRHAEGLARRREAQLLRVERMKAQGATTAHNRDAASPGPLPPSAAFGRRPSP